MTKVDSRINNFNVFGHSWSLTCCKHFNSLVTSVSSADRNSSRNTIEVILIKLKAEVVAFAAISPQNSSAINSGQVLAVQKSQDLEQPRTRARNINRVVYWMVTFLNYLNNWGLTCKRISSLLDQQGKVRRQKVSASCLQCTSPCYP